MPNKPNQPSSLNPTDLSSLSHEEIRALLDRLTLERELQAREEEARARERMIKAREMGAQAAKQAMIEREQAQARCSHLKEDGRSALVGIRDHAHKTVYVCQFCQKILEDPLSPHLQIPHEFIGGPMY